MIIDAHTHLTKLKSSIYSESYENNLDLLLREVGDSGVGHVVVLAGIGKTETIDIDTGTLVKLSAGHENVSVIAGMDIGYTAEDLVELEGWVEKGKIVGIKFYPGYQYFYPSDERCKPIFDIALRYDVPVIFHSGNTAGPAGYMGNSKVKYAMPIHVDDVASDFPELKIIIAHIGNPWLIDCGEVLYKNPNVYADISGLFDRESFDGPPEELQILARKIKEMLVYVGSEKKLLFGTDWPHGPIKPHVEFAKSLGLSQEGQDHMFYKNATELFKIKI